MSDDTQPDQPEAPDTRSGGSPGTPASDRTVQPAENPVPDASVLEPGWSGELGVYGELATSDDFGILGGEAAVPAHDYGPPIESGRPSLEQVERELRELERRVKASSTPVFPIEHRRELPFEFLWKRYRQYAMQARSDVVDELGRDPSVLARIEPLLDFLLEKYFRVAVHGIENVPDTGRAIIVANHAGTLPYDGIMIMQAMRRYHPARRDARPLIEDFLFHFPYLGTLVNRIGGVRACHENARRLLASDHVIVVFPEGQKGLGKLYRERYVLQRFGRGGFIKLALRARAPIIPVAIVGSEESIPMLRKITWLTKPLGVPYIPITPAFPWFGPLGLLPAPSKWTMHFGEPIDVAAAYDPERAEDRLLVNKLADRVRTTIQTMVDESLARRRSVFFG